MFEALDEALSVVFSWPGILLPVLGTLIGFVVGALPGLGAAAGIALLIPLTYSWDAGSALLLLASVVGGTTFSGSVTAILINTPGESANAATLIDGYPMARKGQGSMALSVAAVGSAMGALFGIVVFLVMLPLSRQIILSFSYPETFMVAVVGLFIIALIARGAFVKGLISAGLGFMLSFVGRDLITGNARYTFDSLFLEDGIDFIPVLIGLFALTEAMMLLIEPDPEHTQQKLLRGEHWQQVRDGARVCLHNPRLVLQSSTIGTVCGMIPGVGGSIASFLAYGAGRQSRSDTQDFGKGDPRGVLASEASNDAKDGGALIPTIAFGLPGSAVWAVMLGAFLVHGIAPGREMLTTRLDIVFVIVLALIISNLLTSVIGLASSQWLAPIAKLKGVITAPVIFIISLVGAYTVNRRSQEILVALIAGVVGYFMKKYGFSLIPAVIALILGPIVEAALGQTLLTVGVASFVTRPLSIGILLVGILLFSAPTLSRALSRRRNGQP